MVCWLGEKTRQEKSFKDYVVVIPSQNIGVIVR